MSSYERDMEVGCTGRCHSYCSHRLWADQEQDEPESSDAGERTERETQQNIDKPKTKTLNQTSQDKLSDLEVRNLQCVRKPKATDATLAALKRRLQEETAKRKTEETQKVEIERRFHEVIIKLSKLEATHRQYSRQERETKRLEAKAAALGRLLEEKTAKLSGTEDDARRLEQQHRDILAKNQELHDEINRFKVQVKTLREQASKIPLQVLVRKPDTISFLEVEELIRMLNAKIDQLSSRVTDGSPYQTSPRPPGHADRWLDALREARPFLGSWLFNALHRRFDELKTVSDPLISQLAIQAVLVWECSRIINHWNPPFWDDSSVFFRVNSSMLGAGGITFGTWSGLAPKRTRTQVQEDNVKYLSNRLAKLIVADGGSLPSGKTLLPGHQADVEDIIKAALQLHQIINMDVRSVDLVTYIIPPDVQFEPSQMDDTERSLERTGRVPRDRIICTAEMGLQYRKKAQLGQQGGGEYGVILKPKVVLYATLEYH